MTRLADLYDGDKRLRSAKLTALSIFTPIPHPLHGVDYADGVLLCGSSRCARCRAYRKDHPS